MRHTLNIFAKPKIPLSGYVLYKTKNMTQRLLVSRYKHKISANGWYNTASCSVRLRSIKIAQQFLEQYIGNRVAFYADNGVDPCWEGFINRMTFEAGGVAYTISLDKMDNQVSVMYMLNTGNIGRTAVANNASSQGVYGYKCATADMGYIHAATGMPTAMRDTMLVMRAWPQSSVTQIGQGDVTVQIECLGFFHTLQWETRFVSGLSLQATTMIVGTYLPGLVNGTTFFDNTNFLDIATNTVIVSGVNITGQTIWDIFQGLAEMGDATGTPWVIGITPISPNTDTRRLYYRRINTSIEYTALRSDGLRIRNLEGRPVPPWLVRPDRGVRITDWLPGWSGLGDDPRETYIAEIEYDAESASATYTGADDTTSEGAFQLKNTYRVLGERFGAPTRFTPF